MEKKTSPSRTVFKNPSEKKLPIVKKIISISFPVFVYFGGQEQMSSFWPIKRGQEGFPCLPSTSFIFSFKITCKTLHISFCIGMLSNFYYFQYDYFSLSASNCISFLICRANVFRFNICE